MFNLKVASFALSLLLSQALPSLGTSLPRTLLERADSPSSKGVIEALLRGPISARSESGIFGRQAGTCSVGYAPCTDGNGCCPYGKYCGTWGGKLGCCTIGKTCVANSNPCEYIGDLPCDGETFCCPAGDVCYRDSAGTARCSKPTSGGGGITITSKTTLPQTFTETETDSLTLTKPIVTTPIVTIPTTTFRPTTTRTTATPTGTANSANEGGSSGSTNPFSNSNGASPTTGAASVLVVLAGVAVNLLAFGN